jgi:hypothetical protein
MFSIVNLVIAESKSTAVNHGNVAGPASGFRQIEKGRI